MSVADRRPAPTARPSLPVGAERRGAPERRSSPETTSTAVTGALAEGQQRAATEGPAILALQRQAGNTAVGALLAARMRQPPERARGEIDAALAEMRGGEPDLDTVETGLIAAKGLGVPVDLEGPKPPSEALAVTTTGFGPESVEEKVVPPAAAGPTVSPLAKAAGRSGPPPSPTDDRRRPHDDVASRDDGTESTESGSAVPAALVPVVDQPPVPPTVVAPEADPEFRRVAGGVVHAAADARAHPPATAGAREAQEAAVPPTGDMAGQAEAAKAAAMAAQPAGSFDKKAFIAAVKAATEDASPGTLEEADEYAESGRAGEVGAQVRGLVSEGKGDRSRRSRRRRRLRRTNRQPCRSRSRRCRRRRPGSLWRSPLPERPPSPRSRNSSTLPPGRTR